MAGTRNYQSIGEVLVVGQDRVPRHHDLEDPVPRGRRVDRAGAHAVRVPQVLRGRRRPVEVDPADAARRVPAPEGDQGTAAQSGRRRRRGAERRTRGRLGGRTPRVGAEEIAEAPTGLQMSLEEMSAATGVERDRIKELESFGIVCSHGPDGGEVLRRRRLHRPVDREGLLPVRRSSLVTSRCTSTSRSARRRSSRRSSRRRSARRTPTLGGRPPRPSPICR